MRITSSNLSRQLGQPLPRNQSFGDGVDNDQSVDSQDRRGSVSSLYKASVGCLGWEDETSTNSKTGNLNGRKVEQVSARSLGSKAAGWAGTAGKIVICGVLLILLAVAMVVTFGIVDGFIPSSADSYSGHGHMVT